MKILISPAKKMRTDTDTLSPRPCPPFSQRRSACSPLCVPCPGRS